MSAPYIVPINAGDMLWDHSEAVLRRGMGIKHKGNFICWYIGGTDVPILVDSGLPGQERAQKYHNYTNPVISPDQQLGNALKKKGIDPESIKMVVQTHLHWDHTGNLAIFPQARILVSDAELHYALNPLPIHYVAYEAFGIGLEPPWLKTLGQFKIVKMKEQEIATGVRIFPSPGHTPGGISIYLETSDGPYVIAGDNVMAFEALTPEPDKKLPFNIPGVYTDLSAIWESIQKSLDLVGGDGRRVLPGHDRLVFSQERYPQ
jgi:N-acyl homoserine lactone hydrolase